MGLRMTDNESLEYLCWDGANAFELVTGTQLLRGSHRGQPYRSVPDLTAAQRTVLHSVMSSQEAFCNIHHRNSVMKSQLPRESTEYTAHASTITAKFDQLRTVIDVLEAAVLEQAQLCHEENVAKLREEAETCAALEAELAANLEITRNFVWDVAQDSRAPPKVARADMRLTEIAEMSMEQVVPESLSDTIDLTAVEAVFSHLTKCATESGLGEELRARGVATSPGPPQGAYLSVAQTLPVEEPAKAHDRLHRNAVKKQLKDKIQGPPPFSSLPSQSGYFQDPKGSTNILAYNKNSPTKK